MLREKVSRPESRFATSSFADAGFAAQMAVGANTVATRWLEFDRVDDIRQPHGILILLAGHMTRPRSVTAFTTDTFLKKWRFREAILCTRDWLQPAGVALQAADFDGTRQVGVVVLLKAWRDIPLPCLSVIRDRRLKEVALHYGDVAAASSARTNEVVQTALAAQVVLLPLLVAPQELENCLILLLGNSIGHA